MNFQFSKLRKTFPDSLFRLFPDGTCIDEDKVSLFCISRGAKTLALQDGGNDFAVSKIHLAAIAFNVKSFFVDIRITRKWGKCLTLPSFILNLICHVVEHSI